MLSETLLIPCPCVSPGRSSRRRSRRWGEAGSRDPGGGWCAPIFIVDGVGSSGFVTRERNWVKGAEVGDGIEGNLCDFLRTFSFC